MSNKTHRHKQLTGKCGHKQTVTVLPNKPIEWVCGICKMINHFKNKKQ